MENDSVNYKVPIAEGLYCYTQLSNDSKGQAKYHTVLFGPIMKVWIASGENVLESTLGTHRFIARTDSPMYLIPYDHPICKVYGKMVTFDLHSSEPNKPKSVTIPMEFEPGIGSFFEYKIEAGKLYKQANRVWLLQEI